MKDKRKLRRRLVFLYIGSFIATVAPLALCVGLNFDKYISGPRDAVKLSLGGIIALIFVIMRVAGKLKMPRGIVTAAIVFGMAFLLESVLRDLKVLSLMWLCGEFADLCLFQYAIRKTKEDILVEKTATATAEQVETVMKKYVGRM